MSIWSSKDLSDSARLHEFLASVNKSAASEVVQSLTQGVSTLSDHPRIGEQLYEFEPREVRRILNGNNEVRYEIDKPLSISSDCGIGVRTEVHN